MDQPYASSVLLRPADAGAQQRILAHGHIHTFARAHVLLLTCALGTTCALSGICAAASLHGAPPSKESDLRAKIESLAADSLDVRESTSARLAADFSLSLESIEDLLASGERKGTLTCEQRQRLENIAFTRFVASPRAAMGVQFSMVDALTSGVEIGMPIEGFDSVRVLQAGDVVLKIDNTIVSNQSSMRAVIVSHSPGDSVSLEIERGGERVRASLVMGNYDHLEQRNLQLNPARAGRASRADLDPQILSDAWQIRRERRASKDGPPNPTGIVIEPGLSAGQWTLVSGRSERAIARARIDRRIAGADRMLLRNGAVMRLPRSEPPQAPPPAAMGGGSTRIGFDEEPQVFAAGIRAFELQSKLQELHNEATSLRLKIDRNQSLLLRNGLDAASREMVAKNTTTLQLRLGEVEGQLKQVGVMMNQP